MYGCDCGRFSKAKPSVRALTHVDRHNVRRIYTTAMVEADEKMLNAVYAYLVDEGWAGGISVEEAIKAVEGV